MYWNLLYILLGIKPRTFEELATRAYDMELSIANKGTKDFQISEVKKWKKEIKGTEEIKDSVIKQSIVIHTTPLKFSSKENVIKAEKRDDIEMCISKYLCIYNVSHTL